MDGSSEMLSIRFPVFLHCTFLTATILQVAESWPGRKIFRPKAKDDNTLSVLSLKSLPHLYIDRHIHPAVRVVKSFRCYRRVRSKHNSQRP